MLNGLTEVATGEQMAVAEGVGFINEKQIETAFKTEVLEAVVEDEGIGAKFFDSVAAGLDAVLVNENYDSWEVFSKHKGLIASEFGVQKNILAVTYDFRRNDVCVGNPAEEAPIKRIRLAFIATAEDGDLSSACGQIAGKFLDDGGFSGASDG